MVMESRKAAPALRARLLRSYVPLRRDPSESVLSGTIPGLPGGLFSTHKFKFQALPSARTVLPAGPRFYFFPVPAPGI